MSHSPRTLARWYALMATTFGAVSAVSLLADLTPDAHPGLELMLALGAILSAPVVWIARDRLPAWFYPVVAVPQGVLMITAGIALSGDPSNPGAALYVPIMLFAFYFFSWRAALTDLALCAVAYGVVLAAIAAPSEALDRWLFILTTLSLTGFVIATLRDRLVMLVRGDALTGVLNRRGFDERLERGLDEGDAALLIVDVDDFKSVNDAGGLLRERLGRSALGATVSVGVAARAAGDGPAELMRAADEALYAAKRGGRDRVVAASTLPERFERDLDRLATVPLRA